jgi:hypothetical protein
MRLISAASLVLALALTFAIAEFPPALTASQTAVHSDDSDRHDRDRMRPASCGNCFDGVTAC